jgi:thiol-disulfide isomerase/thioredoxin
MSKDLTFGMERRQIAVLVACVAGLLAAVYWIYALDDSNAALPTARTQPPATQSSMREIPDKITRALSTGKLTAFVIHNKRKPVSDINFLDGSGKQRSIDDWRGKVVLINLWATWCAPCRKEMPELAELQRIMGGDDFEVVAISVDRKGAEASAKFLIEAQATSLGLYIDRTAEILNPLKALGLPATILVDRLGNEVGRILGPAEWAGEDALRLIAAAIKEKG